MERSQSQFVGALLVASLIAGVLGSVVFQLFLNPLFFPPTSDTGSGTVVTTVGTTEVVRTKIFESSISDVAKTVSPAVVSIVVTKDLTLYYRDPFEFFFRDPWGYSTPQYRQEQQQVGGGTGFIVTQDGLIITNKHVVDDTEAAYTAILQDGREVPVQVVSRDPLYDIAVLRIDAEHPDAFKELPTVTLGNSDDLQVGQLVVAIGNALAEYENSVTMGVISAKGRSITAGNGLGSTEALSNLLQTDAAINPGNSGGPLVNLDGEVIGINTAVASNAQGIGFAIPVNQLRSIMPGIETHGRIVRPYLGVNFISITPTLAEELSLPVTQGALLEHNIRGGVRAVMSDSPASRAGLQAGDIITAINDKEITEKITLQEIIANYQPQDVVTLRVLRDEQTLELRVTLAERPGSDAVAGIPGYLGIHTTTITPETAELFQLPVRYGAIISNDLSSGIPGVEAGSPAQEAGLRVNDIIIAVNDTSLETTTLDTALASYNAGERIILTILRNGQERRIAVTLGTKE